MQNGEVDVGAVIAGVRLSFSYTKLFSSITESTVWSEPLAVRVVWITMLAMTDKYGRVWGSVPGLARRANVSLAECQKALKCFLSPDRHSRTPEHDGRRIEVIDGGWRLLNYDKYRAMQDEEAAANKEAERARRYRERKANLSHVEQSRSVTLNHAPSQSVTPSHPIASASVDVDVKTPPDGGHAERDVTIWRVGVDLLTRSGAASERSARAFLGKLAQGDGAAKLAEVIARISLHPVADPHAYIAAAMNGTAVGNQAHEAWQEVRNAIRAGCLPQSWAFPQTTKALDAVGGWAKLKFAESRQLDFTQREFEAAFKEAA